MKTYTVHVKYGYNWVEPITVKANSIEDAKEKACVKERIGQSQIVKVKELISPMDERYES